MGVFLRVQHLGFPPTLTFDEHHFVLNARNFLTTKADWNDHPPIGKLLIAVVIWLHGDDAVGWRIVPLGFGLLSIVLAYFIARALSRDTLAGPLAAAFVAADGFLIAYSRTALLDGMLTAIALGCVLSLAVQSGMPRAIGSGLMFGVATSIKLSGVTLLLPIAWVLFSAPGRWSLRAAHLGVACALGMGVFYAQYALGRHLSGQSASVIDVAEATRTLVVHHLGLTQMTHPLTSYWYSWWLPTRPITMRYDVMENGRVRAMTTLGNPLLWWCSTAAMLASLGALSVRWVLARISGAPRSEDVLARAHMLHGLAWIAFLSPWILTSRDSYIYHYLPSYGLGLVALGALVARFQRRWPRSVLGFVLVVAAVSIFYAPVWGQLPLSPQAYRWRLFLPNWR
jgi:dolichyl-phosphate-mannose--protein O-mannosyl transferase